MRQAGIGRHRAQRESPDPVCSAGERPTPGLGYAKKSTAVDLAMLIRENGQRITLLRASPTRAKGSGAGAARGRAQRHMVVGVFTVADGVPEAIRLRLAPAESRALDRWLAAFHSSLAQHALPPGTRASSWPGLDELLTTLEAIAILVDPNEAQTVRGDIQLVSHALRRGDHVGSRQSQHVRHPLLASEISPTSEERPVAAAAATGAAPAVSRRSAS